jgi:large subunit ribosomal protein L17
MRHLKRTAKLGRTGEHRNAMLANLVCSLIQHKRVTTTLAKAKAARPVAEKLVTLGKSGTIHHRRLAAARLKWNPRRVQKTKAIVKLHQRQGDAAHMAILEWVELPLGTDGTAAKPEKTEAAPGQQSAAPESKPEAEQK